MINIGFLINDISDVGGVERVITTLVNKFSENKKYKIKIISILKPKRAELGFDVNKNIEIIYLNKETNDTGFINNLFLLNKLFIEISNNIELNILFTLHTLNNISAAIIKNKVKYKIIPCQHGQYFFDNKKVNIIKKLIYRRFEILQVLTDRDKEIYCKFVKNVIKIPNPSPFKSEYLYSRENKNIVFMGRLSIEKSVHYLLKAFKEVEDKKGWKLVLVAEGPEKQLLLDFIKKNNLIDCVEFRDFTNDVKSVYAKAGIIALTSQSEALPMVLIESKSFGIPAISFDTRTGPREIIEDSIDGVLVKQNNVREFKEALELLINNDKLREQMAKAAFKNSYKYDIDRICCIWEEIIENL